ncbi:phage portal protein [Streptomyces sp. VNUA74]|uniref:phage portal protein n=1 Tax=Streptomyces sp. VNUA74 TaxID=3062685 RepID=UPI00280B66DF|nr:phage portal protein [Streptomyces sp. VNUA74]WML79173.1 phage portal protein [Streptomyces sp. VNUA74]
MTTTLKALASVFAKTPVPFAPAVRTRGYAGQNAQATTQIRAMESDGTLFAVVAKISESLAGVQWRLYRKQKPGASEEDRVEVTQHQALKVWNRPNAHMSQQRLVETFSQHQCLTGESWLVADRATPTAPPTAIWPVRPDRMAPIADHDEFIVGYEYLAPGGERVPLADNVVMCMLRPNPNDHFRGIGPVQSIMAHIDAARYSAEWNRNFFLSSAEPGGVIEVESQLSDRDFERLTSQWNEQHRGVSAAHRVAILENGTKWVPNTYTRRDMQFAELMEIGDDKILKAFAFPKFMLGIVDDVNRANAEASEYIFAKWTLVPALERIKDCLNTSFLPMFGTAGEGVEFDYDSPVPEDHAAEDASLAIRAAAAAELIAAGFYAPEVQEALHLPVMSFGQPNADPEREMLIDLVKAAPAALFDKIAPLLGIELPEPEPAPVPPIPPGAPEPAEAREPEPAEVEEEQSPKEPPEAPVASVQAAQRWVVVTEDDDNRCGPCADQDGRTYKNRADAYKDYPGGSGYVNCDGEKGGNSCRCKVVKRGKASDDTDEEVSGG